jgi:pantothenate kinase
MNQLEMIKNLMRGGLTPKGITMQMLNNNSNPMLKNLVEMAEKGDYQSIENIARNIYKEQGKNFDQEYEQFKQLFK